MSYRVTMTTTDSVVKEITTDGAATILDAAANQNVVLPSLCGQGACGTCVATITSGEYIQGPISPDAMGPMAGEGAVLLCRTTAKSDCTIDLPYDNNRIIDAAPAQRQARITELDRVAEGVVHIHAELVPDDVHGSAAEFDAGQFMQVDVPGSSAKRAYSMANMSNWDGQLEFYVHLIAGGKFSTWLDEQAQVGDVITLRGPQGAFGLRENGLRPRWFVGGGTGLAQLMAMLRRMAEWGDSQPARLFVGVTTPQQLFGTDHIAEMEGQLLEFSVTTCIWKPDGGELAAELAAGGPGLGEVRVGTPADALAEALQGLDDADGPPTCTCAAHRRWWPRSSRCSPRTASPPRTCSWSASSRTEPPNTGSDSAAGPRSRGPAVVVSLHPCSSGVLFGVREHSHLADSQQNRRTPIGREEGGPIVTSRGNGARGNGAAPIHRDE